MASNRFGASTLTTLAADFDRTVRQSGRTRRQHYGDPQALTALRNGDLLVTEFGAPVELWRVNPADPDSVVAPYGNLGNLPTGLDNPQGMGIWFQPQAELAGDLTGGAGALTGNLTADIPVDPLVLADFDQDGPRVRRARADRGRHRQRWRHFRPMGTRSPRIVAGLLIDGEADIANDAEPLTRLRWLAASDQLNINDNGATNIGAYFDTGGAGADLTLSIQTLSGVDSETIASAFTNGASAVVRLGVNAAHGRAH